jgi:glycosyltransferase involved in cell wall biosynthesis
MGKNKNKTHSTVKKDQSQDQSQDQRMEDTKNSKYPLVSICTPTFNRRPFIPYMLKCFEKQTYPKDRMEWIIIDDGTDKIEDMVSGVPQIKYFKYDEKMTLGKKRNLAHDKCSGSIIVYMDDDDYYPPERVSHAVETLQKNPKALCAGSSIMHIFFKHIGQMYCFGPYGPNHATAATFAFRKELLLQTRFQEHACVAEERAFLKDYTIPFVQLDTMKTILVFSHVHNSFDKKSLIQNGENAYVKRTNTRVDEFVKDTDIFKFFMEDIDRLLEIYQPGKPENKPDVMKQLEEIRMQREQMMIEHQQKQQSIMMNEQVMGMQQKLNEWGILNQELVMENTLLKNKNEYLDNKITKLIQEMILLKKELKEKQEKQMKEEVTKEEEMKEE